jgi:hypothetical protein
MRYNHRYAMPMPHKYYRHTGYVGTWFADPAAHGNAPDGSYVGLTSFVWENPHPDRKIAYVGYVPAENDTAGLILSELYGEIRN